MFRTSAAGAGRTSALLAVLTLLGCHGEPDPDAAPGASRQPAAAAAGGDVAPGDAGAEGEALRTERGELVEVPDRFVRVLTEAPVSAEPTEALGRGGGSAGVAAGASGLGGGGTAEGLGGLGTVGYGVGAGGAGVTGVAGGGRGDRLARQLASSSGVLGAIGSSGAHGVGGGGIRAEVGAIDGDGRGTIVLGANDGRTYRIMGTTGEVAGLGASSGETWDDPGVNGWVDAAEDPLSTFSIDVDTASWTRTRRQLRDGYLPPNAMVRVEEFVNYFPYDYAPPRDGAPFAVHFEGAPSPFHPDRVVARVGLQARRVAEDQRRPVHLTFLVDTSGSMSSVDKLGLVKESLAMLSGELDDGDTVAIVTYAGGSRLVLEPTPATERDRVTVAIESLSAGGSTAMANGLMTAYELADRSYVPGHVNRVIVASDGDANVGPVSPDALVQQIRSHAQRGITLTTLGYGVGNYRDHRMERLANEGDGNYYYVDGRREARRVLVDRMRSTLEEVARDVKLQVEWDPAVVTRYRLVGYENREIADADFRDDAVDAGEVGAGHQVTAVYELQLRPGAEGDPGRLSLRYEAPGPEAPAAERRYTLARAGLRPRVEETSADTRISLSAAWFAEILRDSPHARDVGLAEVTALARGARRPEYDEDTELIELLEAARALGGDGIAANGR